jgi:hypothetical protein
VLLSLATRVAHFAQRTYRATSFEGVCRSADRTSPAHIESWQWALGLELVNVLTALTQMLRIAAYFIVLAPVFGAVNLLLIALLAEALGRLFTRQRAGRPVAYDPPARAGGRGGQQGGPHAPPDGR